MSVYKSIVRELEELGEKITVTSEKGQFTVKGIVQPLLYKNKMYISGKQTPLGFFDGGHYLLICPAKIIIPTIGTVLFECSGKKYVLKRSETVRADSEDIYIWAVLAPYIEENTEDDFL